LNKLIALLVLVFLFLSACSTPAETQIPQADTSASMGDIPPSSNEDILENEDLESPVSFPSDLNNNSLTSQIEGLNIDLNQVRVKSTNQVEWTDTCLGVEQPGTECLPETTPGYWVVMEANGLQFDYHSDRTGSKIRPATLGISWSREGGEQGYCDKLFVYLPDTAHACWCQSGEKRSATTSLLEILSDDEYAQFIDMLREFDENSIIQPESDGTNPAMVSFTFYGQGQKLPDSYHKQSFMELAQEIFSRITQ
jgi:hypothetical protein